MGHEAIRCSAEVGRFRHGVALRTGASLLAALLLNLKFATTLHGQDDYPDIPAPKPFRSSAESVPVRDYETPAAVPSLRPPPPGAKPPAEKPPTETSQTALERLDPFFKPKPKPKPVPVEPEAVEPPLPPVEPEPEPETPERKPRTPTVDTVGMLRASVQPRDIVAVPDAGPEGLRRLGEQQALIGKRWSFHLGASFSATYDDNVTLTDLNPQEDILLSVGTNASLQLGSEESDLFLNAQYGVGLVNYLNETTEQSIDQSFGLGSRYRFTKLTLGLNVSIASTGMGGTVDTGERVRGLNYAVGFDANYEITEKTSATFNATGAFSHYESLISSSNLRATVFLNYQFTPKIQLGAGGGVGLTKAEEATEQHSEQLLVRGTYAASDKLTVNANGGLEFRQTGNGLPTEMTPVFSVGAAYRPFARTTVTLDLRRSTYSSASLTGQDYTSTGISLGIRQELFPRVSVALGAGYELSEYFATTAGVTGGRKDNYLYLRPSLDYEIARWCHLGLFYEYSQATSEGEGAHPFNRSRVGVQLNLMY